MNKPSVLFRVVYLIIMIAVVVGVDIAFFQHHTEWRLIGNISLVALFLAGYFLINRKKK